MEFLDNPFGFTLRVTDETTAGVTITAPFQKEPARREQSDNIKKQLSKLGNSIFKAWQIDVLMEENSFVPSSLVADMRRRAIERLMIVRKIRYRREIVQKADNVFPYLEQRLTYLENVSNSQSEAFYKSHGVKETEPAFELSPRKDVPLMFTKHCLRYSMGWCPVYQKQSSPYKEPYYLLYKDIRLRLQFDCKTCRMLVLMDSHS
jgi:putative protease